MQAQGAFCVYFKVGRVNERQQRPHILLKLLMTIFSSQECLILLGRFVSEFIYIIYLAMQTTQVKSCAFWRASPSTSYNTQKSCTQKKTISFFISVWSLSPSSSWRENVSTKTSLGKGRAPSLPPYRFPNVSLDYFSHNIRYGHEMVLLQQIIVKNRGQKTRWSVLTVVQAHQCNKGAVNAKV